MPLYNNYKLYLTIDGVETPFYPVNETLTFTFKKDQKWKVMRLTVDNSFNFIGDEGKVLIEFNKSCDRCEGLPVIIKKLCGGEETVFAEGFLNMNDGDYNEAGLDACSVTIKPTITDQYNCLYDAMNVKKNILIPGISKVTVRGLIGTIESVRCDSGSGGNFVFGHYENEQYDVDMDINGENSCLPDAVAWSIWQSGGKIRRDEHPGNTPPGPWVQIDAFTIWVRQRYEGSTQPPGDGWVLLSAGVWVRPLEECPPVYSIAGSIAYTAPNPTDPVGFTQMQLHHECPNPSIIVDENFIGTSADSVYDNGVRLEVALNYLLNGCPYTITSNFFGINPDGIYPNNVAYDFALANYQDLIIHQKSDVVNWDTTSNATIGELAINNLLEFFQLLNLCFTIGTDNTLTIEHLSYQEDNLQNGIDLTLPEFAKFIRGKHRYSYDSQTIPERETFAWMDKVSAYFQGNDILYAGNCVKIGGKAPYNTDAFTTDINYLVGNPDDVSKTGFTAMATVEFDGFIYLIDDNKPLSFTEIHPALWLWGRPQWNGQINNVETCFESAQKTKRETDIEFPVCCTEFDPDDRINTNIGWGDLEEMQINGADGTATIALLHDQLKCCEPGPDECCDYYRFIKGTFSNVTYLDDNGNSQNLLSGLTGYNYTNVSQFETDVTAAFTALGLTPPTFNNAVTGQDVEYNILCSLLDLQAMTGVNRTLPFTESNCQGAGGSPECSVALSSTSESCDYSIGYEHPLDATNNFRMTAQQNVLGIVATVSCVVESDCGGTVTELRRTNLGKIIPIFKAYSAQNMTVGSELTMIRLFDNSNAATAVDLILDDGSYLTGPAGTANGADLTYTGANAAAMQSALSIVIQNAIASVMTGTEGTDYNLDVVVTNLGAFNIEFECKHLVGNTNKWIGIANSNATLTYTVGANTFFAGVARTAILEPTACGYADPCDNLLIARECFVNQNTNTTQWDYNDLSIIDNKRPIPGPQAGENLTDTCTDVCVLATTTDCGASPTFSWTRNGTTIPGATTNEVCNEGTGTYEVTVNGSTTETIIV